MSYIFQKHANTTSGGPLVDGVKDGLQLDEWEVPAASVFMNKKIGEGEFGEVYCGIVRGDSDSPRLKAHFRHKDKLFVAVKLLKGT